MINAMLIQKFQKESRPLEVFLRTHSVVLAFSHVGSNFLLKN